MKKSCMVQYLFSLFIVLLAGFILWNCDSSENDDGNPDTSIFTASGSYEGSYWPTSGWRSCSPEEVGMDSQKLMDVYDYVAQGEVHTDGVVIIKDGYIVAEAYFGNFTIDSRHASYSVAKSFMSATVGIAIDKGYLSGVDDKVYHHFTEWQAEGTQAEKKDITIRHLLTMSSGLEWDESDYYSGNTANDAFLMGETQDYIQYVLAKPVVHAPGSWWVYSSGDSMLLSGIIEDVTGLRAYDLALEELLRPIGIPDIIWYNDPAGHTIGGWGIWATVREYAKFGYLYLNNGQWDNQQIVSEGWIEESTSPAYSNVPFYGYQWWLLPALNGYQSSSIPADTYLAWGIYTQQIFVIPSLDLLVVRVANDPGSQQWREVDFLELILDCLQ